MIFVTGDFHGNQSWNKKNVSGHKIKPEDYIIFAGDFGVLWEPEGLPPEHNAARREAKALRSLLKRYPCTILFVDGNHENFDRLFTLPQEERFGAPVGIVHERIWHLQRGYVYVIEGRKVFAFGGAASTDKSMRVPYVSWWPQEIPNWTETERGLDKLHAVDNQVDLVVTHEAPPYAISQLGIWRQPCPEGEYVKRMLHEFWKILEFKTWCFGHYHEDVSNEKFHCLFHRIISV